MKKVHKISKIVAIVLVFATIVSFTPAINASADVALVKYQDKNFTWRSDPESFVLIEDYNTLSYAVFCEDNKSDSVILHILNKSTGDEQTVPIISDGAVYTISLSFPEGRYHFYFTGSEDVVKTLGIAIFGIKESVIDFVWPFSLPSQTLIS